MTDVWLRTDLKTTGGEVNDIMWKHQCIGLMTLVYREADRITGSVQLEQAVLPEYARQQALTMIQAHMESLAYALGVRTCEVTVSYSELDLLESATEAEASIQGWAAAEDEAEQDYTVVRTKGDSDTYIFEIYQQSHGGLPIGTATIDASYRQLQGFIDFREPCDFEDRETIAMLMMQELDKEKDFDSFNLIMLYQNQPFEEINYEADWVH